MTIKQEELVKLANNPIRGINRIVAEIENNWFNKKVNVNSKSHPFVLLTDITLGTTHGFLNRVDDSIAKLFPVHARGINDLSKHMGEDEKVGLFANPSTSTFHLLLSENVFFSVAKDVTASMGRVSFTYKKLLIPKDTSITINGYDFSIENGVEIRYSDKAGYQVVYDTTTSSFFNPISNNLLDREVITLGNRRYLKIDVPVRQLSVILAENITSNEASGCSGTISYNDYLYGIRAYITQSNGLRKEIKVTYNQDTFDTSEVTLCVIPDTTKKEIHYEIPDAYINNGLGLGTLDMYVMVTKGQLVKDFTNVNLNEVKILYSDFRYGSGKLGEFSSKIKNAPDIVWKPVTKVSGGSNPIPFEVIKRNFIHGRRIRSLPITENNLVGDVEQYGYHSIKSIDFTTGRKYTITRELPTQYEGIENNESNTNRKLIHSSLSCYVGSVTTSIDDLIRGGLVYDHGQRVTIPNTVLFDITGGVSRLVSKTEQDGYIALSNENKVDLVRNKTLVYTPFHYVLDTTSNQVDIRTYHLDNPRLNYQTFVSENVALGVEVGVGSLDIVYKGDGYLLTLVTRSGETYKSLLNESVGIQLSINPVSSNTQASIKGELVAITEDNERVFEFKLDSTFDIDKNSVIYLNNFHQFGDYQDSTGIELSFKAEFLFLMTGDSTETDTDSDRKINTSLFNSEMISIIETHYDITLGKEFKNLYSRIRPITGEAQYKRYVTDVYAVHDKDVFETDEFGHLVLEDGKLILKHRAGDIKLTDTGQPIIEHNAGSIVYNGNIPELLVPRKLIHNWDFVAFDATYLFSKDEFDIEYAREIKDYFVSVIDKDLEAFTAKMLDQTELVFQPRSKIGFNRVLINSNSEVDMRQDLSFSVTYYLSKTGYKNQDLKTSLMKNTPLVINKVLSSSSTIGTGIILEELRKDIGSDVIDIKLDALAGDINVDVISNLNELTGFSVRKLLRLTGDGLLGIEEDIEVIFLPHGN